MSFGRKLIKLPRSFVGLLPAVVDEGAAQSSDARPTVAAAEGCGQRGGQLDSGLEPDQGSAERTGPGKENKADN